MPHADATRGNVKDEDDADDDGGVEAALCTRTEIAIDVILPLFSFNSSDNTCWSTRGDELQVYVTRQPFNALPSINWIQRVALNCLQ